MTRREATSRTDVALGRARVERELARLRSSLSRETGGGWKARPWTLLLVAGAAGVALATAVRGRRLTSGRRAD